jgi:CHAD domain-containing protein
MPVLAEDPTGERLHAWVVEQIKIATKRLSTQGGRIHEGVRQARKAIRRARAALMLAEPALGPGAAALGQELRRTNRALSALRDAHALVAVIERLALKSHSQADTLALRRAQRTAAFARAAVVRDPAHRNAVAEASEMLAQATPALAVLP